MGDIALLETSGIDLEAEAAFERLELGDEGLPSYQWAGTDAAITDANTYRTMAERNLWAIAAVCHSLERVTGRFNERKGEVVDGDIKKFCAETGVTRAHVYNLSRSYGLARTFVSDVCQQTSLNLLSVTHFQEASVLEPGEAIKALEWALDNGINGSAASCSDLRKHVRSVRNERVKGAGVLVDAAEGEAEQAVEGGQVWRLGRHTLYVGDTSDEAFKSICERAALAFADPPYNANAASWDNNFSWRHDYLGEFAAVTVVTPGISAIYDFARLTSLPYKWSLACWITNGMTRGALGFGNWIYAGVFSDGSVYRQGQDFYKVTINSAETDESSHKGRKPAAFLGWLIETFTKPDETVIDPFLGSGTTLLMAEKLGRSCIGGELSPEYCREIIGRWEKLTGQKAVQYG